MKAIHACCAAIIVSGIGCAKMQGGQAARAGAYQSVGAAMLAAPAMPARAESQAPRLRTWSAWMNVEVRNVSNAVARATELATAAGGFVEETSGDGVHSARLNLRVPAGAFAGAVDTLGGLGDATQRSVSSSDVTEEYYDVDARLKNLAVLRDRLKELLGRAVDVKDVLAIETEMNRVQGELDSLQARMKALQGMVDLARITVNFERKRVLGPLGYVFKGIWLGIEKLFILRR